MWISDGGEATSVWYPPGAVELTLELEAKVEPLFQELVGQDQATKIMELMHGFESHGTAPSLVDSLVLFS